MEVCTIYTHRLLGSLPIAVSLLLIMCLYAIRPLSGDSLNGGSTGTQKKALIEKNCSVVIFASIRPRAKGYSHLNGMQRVI